MLENGRPVRSLQVIIYEAFLQAKKFYPRKPVSTNHAQQLKLAVKKSGPDHSEIVQWAKLFAQKHRLSFSEESSVPSALNGLGGIVNRLNNMCFIYTLRGSLINPIGNVSDASVIIGALKHIRPTIAATVVRHIKNRIGNV